MSRNYEVEEIGVIAAGVVGVVAVVAVLVIGSQEEDAEGTVYMGADGQEYILPNDPQRPEYANRDDCVADIRERIDQIKKEAEDDGAVPQNPEELCEPVSLYGATDVPNTYFYGPIIAGDSGWNSPRARGWQKTIPQGSFNKAAAGSAKNIFPKAEAGAKVGTKAVVRGGFGSSGKGFSSGASS